MRPALFAFSFSCLRVCHLLPRARLHAPSASHHARSPGWRCCVSLAAAVLHVKAFASLALTSFFNCCVVLKSLPALVRHFVRPVSSSPVPGNELCVASFQQFENETIILLIPASQVTSLRAVFHLRISIRWQSRRQQSKVNETTNSALIVTSIRIEQIASKAHGLRLECWTSAPHQRC